MSNIKDIENLLKKQIVWTKERDRPEWHALIDDEECRLTMNDFPAEPLYTLRWRGQQLDIDDAPMNWSIPE